MNLLVNLTNLLANLKWRLCYRWEKLSKGMRLLSKDIWKLSKDIRKLRTPSSVNGLYTPLGSIDSLPPPYLPCLSWESNPVFGEQKRLSTYWSARRRCGGLAPKCGC